MQVFLLISMFILGLLALFFFFGFVKSVLEYSDYNLGRLTDDDIRYDVDAEKYGLFVVEFYPHRKIYKIKIGNNYLGLRLPNNIKHKEENLTINQFEERVQREFYSKYECLNLIRPCHTLTKEQVEKYLLQTTMN